MSAPKSRNPNAPHRHLSTLDDLTAWKAELTGLVAKAGDEDTPGRPSADLDSGKCPCSI